MMVAMAPACGQSAMSSSARRSLRRQLGYWSTVPGRFTCSSSAVRSSIWTMAMAEPVRARKACTAWPSASL